MVRLSIIITFATILAAIGRIILGGKIDPYQLIVVWMLMDAIEAKHETKDKALAKSFLDIWRKR